MGQQMHLTMARSFDTRPTVNDLQEGNQWVNLARTHWLNPSKLRKVKPEVIKHDIWECLESEGFALRSILILENLHILEK
jgi:intron-binding protein aquarius